MTDLVSSMREFNAFGQLLSSISCCSTDVGYSLFLHGDSADSPLCMVGTCRGSIRYFKTLASVESWLDRQKVSTSVPLRVVRDSISITLRCSGCGRFGAMYDGAAFCSKCISSLSLECDARTE